MRDLHEPGILGAILGERSDAVVLARVELSRVPVQRAGRSLVRLASCPLLLISMLACPPAKPKVARGVSPWTKVLPEQDANNFADLTKSRGKLTFVYDEPTKTPIDIDGLPTAVAVYPESRLAAEFDPKGKTTASLNDPGLSNTEGRVIAKIVLTDHARNFQRLNLMQGENAYVIWWVQTYNKPNWQDWTNHYYKVITTNGSTQVLPVNPAPSNDPAQFWFCDDGYTPGQAPQSGDWKQHPTGGCGPYTPPIGLVQAHYLDGQSTWVSCGSGCCNGR